MYRKSNLINIIRKRLLKVLQLKAMVNLKTFPSMFCYKAPFKDTITSPASTFQVISNFRKIGTVSNPVMNLFGFYFIPIDCYFLKKTAVNFKFMQEKPTCLNI